MEVDKSIITEVSNLYVSMRFLDKLHFYKVFQTIEFSSCSLETLNRMMIFLKIRSVN